MTRIHRLTLIAVLILFSLALAAARPFQDGDAGHEHVLMTKLYGVNEAPGPGDPDGKGQAKITLLMDDDQHLVCWSIHVKDILLPASAAHIHFAPVGAPGPVVVPLSAPDESGKSSGCIPVTQELHMALHINTAAYYVNVHNADFPAGAVRGQLRLTD